MARGKRQLRRCAHLIQQWIGRTAWLNLVCQINDHVQLVHPNLAGCVAGNGPQHLRVGYMVAACGQESAGHRMKQVTAFQQGRVLGEGVRLTNALHFLQGQALGTVMQ